MQKPKEPPPRPKQQKPKQRKDLPIQLIQCNPSPKPQDPKLIEKEIIYIVIVNAKCSTMFTS